MKAGSVLPKGWGHSLYLGGKENACGISSAGAVPGTFGGVTTCRKKSEKKRWSSPGRWRGRSRDRCGPFKDSFLLLAIAGRLASVNGSNGVGRPAGRPYVSQSVFLQRTFEPTLASFSKVATMTPSAPSAASSMPWDSTPMSFVGCRLARRMIVLPTSSSGL